MEQANSTTVVVVGPGSSEVLDDLDRLPNVTAAPLGSDPDSSVAHFVRGAHTSYVAHDRDPLEHVAAAWVELFEERATLGTLDLEVETAVEAFRRGAAELPDYYIVLEPESLVGTWKHWWLGVLGDASPNRVLPAESDVASVRRMLGRLPSGRPWPQPDRWLPALRMRVPDRVGIAGA
ncbi:hypothetical protein [Diaminobutyricimonas aerilata]|nr:hypothetical protein [Diaminobutyricimonas aerilata]